MVVQAGESNVKLKYFHYFIKYCVMNTYDRVEDWLHTFLAVGTGLR